MIEKTEPAYFMYMVNISLRLTGVVVGFIIKANFFNESVESCSCGSLPAPHVSIVRV